ncbi:MAG TPA: aminotransferase class V-fold PLP-dependent enzyme [Solirubrobacteraceae bacterium]|nr:aminotransferase class V-fold PLP-dependent enzyme [Solirubrobacteraceae bacterium]
MTALRRAAELAEEHLAGIADRRVGAVLSYEDTVAALDEPLPEHGEDPVTVIEHLAATAGPATVASPGPRYFGFVTGGALPAALAADWLVSAWDQNAFSRVSSPAAAAVEAVVERWVLEALGLPPDAAVGVTTGATTANFVALAAARHAVLERAGWDAEADGLFGAPAIRVLVGEQVHASLLSALRYAGLGADRAERVPTDDQGAMRADALVLDDRPTIVCAQAGEVATGAVDPLDAIADAAAEHGAWVHVDGAFGLWAAASPRHRDITHGAERAHSWAVDAHKWLNVPYDGALAIVADRAAVRAAMSMRASYLPDEVGREPIDYVPEASRRARALPIYAALRQLGRSGIAELVDRCCALARRLAAAMEELDGARVLNDVVLNQVLVRFGDSDETTRAVIAHVQDGGEAWLGGTVWNGQAAARVSVSNWSTTEEDVDRLAAALADGLGRR